LYAIGFDAIASVNIDKGNTMGGADPLQVQGNTIGHDVGSRFSGKLIVVTIGCEERVEGLSDVEGGVFRNRLTSDELGGRDYDEENIAHAMFISWHNGYSIKTNVLAMLIIIIHIE